MANIHAFLQKSFSSLLSSIILPLPLVNYQLVKVAKANSYVETLGSCADTLHGWIKKSYEEDFRAAFEKQVRKALKHLSVRYAKLAFDITTEPFYGKARTLHIIETKGESYGAEFKTSSKLHEEDPALAHTEGGQNSPGFENLPLL